MGSLLPDEMNEFLEKLATLMKEHDVTMEIYFADNWSEPYLEFDSESTSESKTIGGYFFESKDIESLIVKK